MAWSGLDGYFQRNTDVQSWWAGGWDVKDWESLGPGLPRWPVSSAWVGPWGGRGGAGRISRGSGSIRGDILTARVPTIKLAALEVSKQRQISTFQEHTRLIGGLAWIQEFP